jgi:hypothetical protein
MIADYLHYLVTFFGFGLVSFVFICGFAFMVLMIVIREIKLLGDDEDDSN